MGVLGGSWPFFRKISKKWTIFEICGSVPICWYHWFCYFYLWRQKIIDFAFLFKIWDLAKKSHFSSYLNKKAEYANFIDSRLIHIWNGTVDQFLKKKVEIFFQFLETHSVKWYFFIWKWIMPQNLQVVLHQIRVWNYFTNNVLSK